MSEVKLVNMFTKIKKFLSNYFCSHSGFTHHLHIYDERVKYDDIDANGIILSSKYVMIKCACTKCGKTFLIERLIHKNKWTGKIIKLEI